MSEQPASSTGSQKLAPFRRDVLFASQRSTWGTPASLFTRLHNIYAFDTDVAADKDNALCHRYCSADATDKKSAGDGLHVSWANWRVWCNPPYGRGMIEWIAKAQSEAKHAQFIVMLVPARTDTLWWQEAKKSARIEYLVGRLKFGDSQNCAPFPSALIYWNC